MSLLGALLASVLLADAAPVKKTDADRPYKQTQNIVYEESHGIGLLLDVFEPTGPKNGAGIVDVASGAYYSDRGKIEDHRRAQMFDIFCGMGFTVFAVRPGSVTKFTLPEMLDNVKQGVRWVKAHSQEYGVDPDRLGLTGASAGGHLCSLAALTADSPTNGAAKRPYAQYNAKVKAVCAFFPPTDMLEFGNRKFDIDPAKPIPWLLGPLLFPRGYENQPKEKLIEAVTKISPARQVTKSAPPFLLFHGTADPMVPLQQSQALHSALQKEGIPSTLIIKEGGGHPWPTIHEEVQVAADWLRKQLVAP
jgi:acetyl esterase/lipase